MRALGLMLVFMAHAELSFGEGGFVALDTFFVISGFLITGLVLKELEKTGRLSLRAFYARRVRRLLPLAVVVLVFVLAGSWLLYSPVQSDRVAGDVVAASLYVVNWHFAAQEVDYFAVDPADSPLQHFWSLSVEEQFYLLWPALIVIALAWARRRPRSVRPALWGVVAGLGVPAFIYSVFILDYSTHAAYFSTIPRVWEFAAGGALALLLPPVLRLAPALSWLLAWGGLAAILAGAFLFTEEMAYPGILALARRWERSPCSWRRLRRCRCFRSGCCRGRRCSTWATSPTPGICGTGRCSSSPAPRRGRSSPGSPRSG